MASKNKIAIEKMRMKLMKINPHDFTCQSCCTKAYQ